MDRLDLQSRVARIPFWYHRIELPHSVVTPGINPIVPTAYRVPERLDGMRVLDVGAWDGYWSFEALRRGAAEVVAVDDFSDYLGHLSPDQRRAWESFDLCREALGYSERECRRIEMSVYDISAEKLGGCFDLVFLFGTLYHLRHPLLGLDKLSAVCSGKIIIESQICDDYSAYHGFGHGYPSHHMVAEFFPTNELAGNHTNWWAPTLRCLAGLAIAAGFVVDVEAWKLVEKPNNIGLCRGFVSGRKAQK